MSEINKVLNDESKNDKELIKELSVYVKNHKNKKLPINKEFVKGIIDISLRNSEVDFKKIEFVNDMSIGASWLPESMGLEFNLTGALKYARLLKDYRFHSKVGDNDIFLYYSVIEFVIHELTHARQYYVNLIEKNEVYNSCEELIEKKYDVYRVNHDKVLIERYAHLRGHTLAYEVLSYIYSMEQIQEFRRIIYVYLLMGYKVNHNGDTISALDKYNELMKENSLSIVNIDSNDDMTLYDRLYLGLPISTLEYHKLKLLYADIWHNDDKTQKVKTLINKL